MKKSEDIIEAALKGSLIVIAIIFAISVIGEIIEPFMEADDTAESVVISSSADGEMITVTADSLDGLYDAIDGYTADGYTVVTYPAPYGSKTSAAWFTTMVR